MQKKKKHIVKNVLPGSIAQELEIEPGDAVLAVENIEGYFPMPSEYMPNTQTFMLRVKGESMIEAGILDGDLIIAERTPFARNGDMVVALVDDKQPVREHGLAGVGVRILIILAEIDVPQLELDETTRAAD